MKHRELNFNLKSGVERFDSFQKPKIDHHRQIFSNFRIMFPLCSVTLTLRFSAVMEQNRFQQVSLRFRKRCHDYTPNGNKSFYDRKRIGNMLKSGPVPS